MLSEMEQPEDAAIAATRILQAVAEAHSIDQHDLHVTTSIGVSVYPDDGLDAETLIQNADTAMYQAKENGHRSLKLRVVAEGVETQEELKFLQAHECDEAQGYYFSRPVVAQQFANLLKTGVSEAAVFVHR